MLRRLAALLPLVIGMVGCVEGSRPLLLQPEGYTQTSLSRFRGTESGAAATEATAVKVLTIGQKLIDANPQTGLRPMFITVGAPHPEVFHKGGGLRGWQIFVSEGLVNACQNEAQLAAVLSLEMGKIVAERAALAGPVTPQGDERLPTDVEVGRDVGGTFGPPDGTRLMEQARLTDKPSAGTNAPAVPSPQILAKRYLSQAGYDAAALEQISPLLRKAEDHFAVEKQLHSAEIGLPIPTPSQTPSETPIAATTKK